MCSVQFTQGSRLEAVPMTVGPRAAENMGHTAVPPHSMGVVPGFAHQGVNCLTWIKSRVCRMIASMRRFD
jgi:hypothetical protein